ncbi:MAG TPA: alpha/beta fold hydrolase [Anaerolineae bacterium]|nr:alpha/beta fold hydrolase [Anaerolineae bacterium]HMR66557.1 alpha/beta fold hydrolase [Anaerolineae bacterium]
MAYVYNHGIRINYQVEGEGPALVLYHGLGQDWQSWYEAGYVEALKKDYRLLLIDSRGQGASQKIYDPAAYGLKEEVGDVVAMLDDLGIDQAHYFGYALGGWVGLGLAKYAPGRLRSLAIGGAQPYGQDMAPYRAMLQGGMATCLASVEQAAGVSLLAAARQRFLSNDHQALSAAYANDRPDISKGLRLATMPALLFAGAKDPLKPAIERCAAELPNATFVAIPGLSHIQLGLQLHTVLPQLTDFLAKVERRSLVIA